MNVVSQTDSLPFTWRFEVTTTIASNQIRCTRCHETIPTGKPVFFGRAAHHQAAVFAPTCEVGLCCFEKEHAETCVRLAGDRRP